MKDSYFKITNKEGTENHVYFDLSTRSGRAAFACGVIGYFTVAYKVVKGLSKIFKHKKEND